jgi:anti-anti-sigma regulatory factor/predicted hydrocarbon binding protein
MADQEGIKAVKRGILEAFGDRRFLISVTRGFSRLKKTIAGLEGEAEAAWIFYESGKEYGLSVAERLVEAGEAQKGEEGLKKLLATFESLGGGVVELNSLEEGMGRAVFKGKDLPEAWAIQRLGVEAGRPACDFVCGMIAGFFGVLKGEEEMHCIETSCQALGAEACTLEVVPKQEAKEREDRPIFAKEALKELEEANAQLQETLAAQQRFIRELSTPITEVWEGILVLPLVGTIDSERTMAVMEALLERIVATQSETVIVDLSGVPVVDTHVADSLIRTAEAASLLGGRTFLSGISPKMAQTLAHLGVELANIETFASLREALAAAILQNKVKGEKTGQRSAIEALL